ncbi:hypothetical protein BsIDN1_51390 [Bacillus safensis]|uniref:Argininosuccinate lyase C-terminal domain-containing protein n=1 Tax=Bacillus safensis TaxID=561879 RepID=A0A5S9MEY9_BACIA|nr:hypothetical protein BsIDN1_51390 [Bacillus safensis]
MPFREAHEIVGKLVYTCIQKGIYLSDLPFETFTEASELFEQDIYTVLDPYVAVEKRTSAGGTGFKQIQLALEKKSKKPAWHNLSKPFVYTDGFFLSWKKRRLMIIGEMKAYLRQAEEGVTADHEEKNA